jgi:hypothetical protein
MSRLERWSRRKRGEDQTFSTDEASGAPEATLPDAEDPQVGESSDAVPAPPEPGSLDHTLPDPDTLSPGSDIKAFLEPGVSRALKRRALRRLFAGDKYGIRDGLDDYDLDYRTKLKPLASELAQRMRQWTRPAEDGEQPASDPTASEGGDVEASPAAAPPVVEAETETHAPPESPRSVEGDSDPFDQRRVGNLARSDQD